MYECACVYIYYTYASKQSTFPFPFARWCGAFGPHFRQNHTTRSLSSSSSAADFPSHSLQWCFPGAAEELSTPAVTAPEAEEAATRAYSLQLGRFVVGFSWGNKGLASPALLYTQHCWSPTAQLWIENETPDGVASESELSRCIACSWGFTRCCGCLLTLTPVPKPSTASSTGLRFRESRLARFQGNAPLQYGSKTRLQKHQTDGGQSSAHSGQGTRTKRL